MEVDRVVQQPRVERVVRLQRAVVGVLGSTAGGSAGSSTATGSSACASPSKSWGRKNECGAGVLVSMALLGLMTTYF
jgi:hypothetical protein